MESGGQRTGRGERSNGGDLVSDLNNRVTEISFTLMGRIDKEIGSMEMTLEKSKTIYLCKSQCNKSGSKTLHFMKSYHFMSNRWGNSGKNNRLYFLGGPKITADGDCSHLKGTYSLGEKL